MYMLEVFDHVCILVVTKLRQKYDNNFFVNNNWKIQKKYKSTLNGTKLRRRGRARWKKKLICSDELVIRSDELGLFTV